MAKCEPVKSATAQRVCDCLTPQERGDYNVSADAKACAKDISANPDVMTWMKGKWTVQVVDSIRSVLSGKSLPSVPATQTPAQQAPQSVVVQQPPAAAPVAPAAAAPMATNPNDLTEESIFDSKRSAGDRSTLMGMADNRVKSLAIAAKIAAGDDDLGAADIKAMDVSVVRSMHTDAAKLVLSGLDKVLGQSDIKTDTSAVRKLNDLKTKLGGAPATATQDATPGQSPSPSNSVVVTNGLHGFYGEVAHGLDILAATYTDSMGGTLIAPIKTGSAGYTNSPSGNWPGSRLHLAGGYAFPVGERVSIPVSLQYRLSRIIQGYESPELGRAIPDLNQHSLQASFGISGQATELLSFFADVSAGIVYNTIGNNVFPWEHDAKKGEMGLQTVINQEAQAAAKMENLHGTFLAGKVRLGAALDLHKNVSIFSAFELYGDSTQAEVLLPGGGTLRYGTERPEVSWQLGLRFK